MITRLCNDESGLLTFEWVMLFTLLTIGIIGGVAAIRDALIVETAETASAIVVLEQAYTVSGSGTISISDKTIPNGGKVEEQSGFASEYSDAAGKVDAKTASAAGGGTNTTNNSGNTGGFTGDDGIINDGNDDGD